MVKTARVSSLEPRLLFAAGDADLSFGVNGVVAENLGANLNVARPALLPDDKLLVPGAIARTNFGDFDYMLRRYNPDGTPDITFGDNGTVSGRFRGVSTRIVDMRVAANGKILALALDDEAQDELIVVRFNADGSIDGTFSEDGFLVRPFGAGLYGICTQVDGRVIVAAAGDLIRYTADGELDATFGVGGVVEDLLDSIQTVESLGDGSILVGGGAPNSGVPVSLSMTKLNADGSIDASFGDNGTATTDLDGSSSSAGQFMRDIIVLQDGNILAFGEVGFQSVVVKYDSGGSIDMSFGDQGSRGFLTTASTYTGLVDDEGRIYMTTFAGGVTRLTGDGDLDPEFGRVMLGGPEGFPSRVAGISSTGRLITAGDDSRETPPTLLIVSRLTEDDGNPSPITLSGGILNIMGTSNNDAVYAEDFRTVGAVLNQFGRVFDKANVNLIRVTGGAGDDRIRLDDVREITASVSGGLGRDKITGGRLNDTLLGNGGRDFIDGNWGADLIVGNGGNDQLRGQGGKDRVYGREGNDYVDGGNGDDRLRGDSGTDVLAGGSGDDLFITDDSEIDQLVGDLGNDTASADRDDLTEGVEILL